MDYDEMTHDPLCPVVTTECIYDDHVLVGRYGGVCDRCDISCDCHLIAQVRADMLQRVVDLGYYIDSNDPFEQGYTIGREMAIEVLSKAVVGS
jgi:hypothetical protein